MLFSQFRTIGKRPLVQMARHNIRGGMAHQRYSKHRSSYVLFTRSTALCYYPFWKVVVCNYPSPQALRHEKEHLEYFRVSSLDLSQWNETRMKARWSFSFSCRGSVDLSKVHVYACCCSTQRDEWWWWCHFEAQKPWLVCRLKTMMMTMKSLTLLQVLLEWLSRGSSNMQHSCNCMLRPLQMEPDWMGELLVPWQHTTCVVGMRANCTCVVDWRLRKFRLSPCVHFFWHLITIQRLWGRPGQAWFGFVPTCQPCFASPSCLAFLGGAC